MMATAVGFPGQSRRWTDESPAGFDARVKHLRASLATLQQFNRGSLPSSEQLNFDLYHELLETAVQGLPFGDDPMPFRGVTPANRWMPVNQMGGIQQGAAETLATMPYQKPSDYEDIIARLEALPAVVDQTSGNLQEGLKRGYTPPKITMRDVPKQITDLIPADPLKSALLEPLTEFPPNFTAAERNRLTDRAKQIYANSIVPAFQKLNNYLVATYIPACRENITASALPDGAAAYAFHVRWQTTTHLAPEQIHEIGLAEIKRIRGEMDKVIQSTGFQGNFHAFTEFLRTNPQFYYTQPDDLVNAYRIIVKKIDPELAHELEAALIAVWRTRSRHSRRQSQTTHITNQARIGGAARNPFREYHNPAARPKWKWRRCPCTNPSPVIISDFLRKKWKTFQNSAGTLATLHSWKVGRSTRKVWARIWGCTKTLTRNSGSSATKCGAPCDWSSIRGCTQKAGPANRRLTFFERIPGRRIRTLPWKWIDTLCGPDKHWRTS
jgi:hypothetical protein